MIIISEQPAEIEDRAVPGHWEGDLIVGGQGKSAIVTLVERQTRYLLLARIGRDKTSSHVCAAIAKRIRTLPDPWAIGPLVKGASDEACRGTGRLDSGL